MSRVVNGIPHGKRCACRVCDPDQKLLAAQRERAAEERARVAAGGAPAPARVLAKSPGARPMRFRPPQTWQTRRLAELLRQGKGFAEAAQIIEAEQHQHERTNND